MSDVRPFKALRPVPELADKVAALPYDVMSSAEAREMVKDNPYSFLRVTKSEIDFDPETNQYDASVYETAAKNLKKLEADGTLFMESKPCYYIYAQTMNGRTQTGIAACASADEYLNGSIKKHEFTREEKEKDRIRHVTVTDANTGPVFLTHKPHSGLTAFIKQFTNSHKPEYCFTPDDGVTHTAWVVDDENDIETIRGYFLELDALYIADGHHRNASTVKVALQKRAVNPGYSPDEPYNHYLSVIFSSDELNIMDYNRVVKSLNGLSKDSFMEAVSESFNVSPFTENEPYRPESRHTFGMYLGGQWYKLTAKPSVIIENDPVAVLDVSILQVRLLDPVLGIENPRTSENIDFIGGLRGLHTLETYVDSGKAAVAFSMFPTSMDELIAIADSGQVMPPKSTWFEPKLRSGLFVHKLS